MPALANTPLEGQRTWPAICFMHCMTLAKKRQVLQRAAELVGRDQLAERLGTPETQLDVWIRGQAAMPDGKLFVLAALLDKVAAAKK